DVHKLKNAKSGLPIPTLQWKSQQQLDIHIAPTCAPFPAQINEGKYRLLRDHRDNFLPYPSSQY
ncbi:hypothetical protein BT69DRAFT_1279187, partial [Atractiella rhizophila]